MTSNSITPLWEHQKKAFDFCMNHNAAMLDYGMGTGKTLTAIHVIAARGVKRVLIVCPKAVMSVWPREIKKHGLNAHVVDFSKCKSVADKVLKLQEVTYAKVPTIVVLNYDIVWREGMRQALQCYGFEMIICDESHRIKAPGSKVSYFMGLLGKTVKYRLCLSGTPFANNPLDIYAQYRFLDPAIYGTRFKDFKHTYAIVRDDIVQEYRNLKHLQEKFRLIAISCKMGDIKHKLGLPDIFPPVIKETTLAGQAARMYKEMAQHALTELDNGEMLDASNVLVQILRLMQMTSGFLEDGTGISTAKQDLLRDIVDDLPTGDPEFNLVIFCQFTYDIAVVRDIVGAYMPTWELSGNRNDLSAWEMIGGCLVVQIASGAEGIDLTAAHTAIYYSRPLSLAKYEQSKARLYRPGQTRRVTFIHCVVSGTVDAVIYQALEEKKAILDGIQRGELESVCMPKIKR